RRHRQGRVRRAARGVAGGVEVGMARTPRIVDAVFRPGASAARRGVHAGAGVVAAIAVHAAFVAVAALNAPTLEDWGEAMALRVHALIGRAEVVDLAKPDPPPPPPVTKEPAPPPVAARKAPSR